MCKGLLLLEDKFFQHRRSSAAPTCACAGVSCESDIEESGNHHCMDTSCLSVRKKLRASWHAGDLLADATPACAPDSRPFPCQAPHQVSRQAARGEAAGSWQWQFLLDSRDVVD
jgi:hypothetical protein